MEDTNSNSATNNVDKNKTQEDTSFSQFLKPTYLIVGSCLPLFLGAYAGYRSELSRAATASTNSLDSYSPGFTSSGGGLLKRVVGEEILSNNNTSNTTKLANKVVNNGGIAEPNVNIPRMAFKALGIGSLLSIGGFGLLTFGASTLKHTETHYCLFFLFHSKIHLFLLPTSLHLNSLTKSFSKRLDQKTWMN